MKLDKSRQSVNIEDQRGNSSASAFKTDRTKNPAILRVKEQRRKELEEYGEKAVKQTMDNKNSPFRKILKDMDKPLPHVKKHADIPIPTERPDPSKPYTKPTIFTNLTGYNSQVTPGDWKEKK